ncbi:hypothetical protein ACPXB3_12650 [Gordonia sp. DT219]|uniref:hypothetical protein n=1 Tax=Gordonia sp. DT219 TaxID=3416658 RepID=UPI003CF2A201
MRAPDLFHALVLLNLLFACGLWTLLRPSGRAALVLIVVGIAWVIWNKPLEGSTMIRITDRHGITEADLLSLVALWIAFWACTRAYRRAPTRNDV